MTDSDLTAYERDAVIRHSRLFPTDTRVGIPIGPGWHAILTNLFDELSQLREEARRPFHIVQVKEKFGTLRVYLSHPTDATNAAIDRASRLSAGICEFCGVPSTIRNRDGWFTTQCDPCARKGIDERE